MVKLREKLRILVESRKSNKFSEDNDQTFRNAVKHFLKIYLLMLFVNAGIVSNKKDNIFVILDTLFPKHNDIFVC